MLFNADSRKSNADLRRFTINLLRLILLFLLLLTILPLAAQEKLEVAGDLTVKSADSGPPRYGLVLKPQNATPSAQEGQLYYNDANNRPYYYNGATWQSLVGDKYVATKIVAASDSLDTTCVGFACSNPRADYTCNGTADQNIIQVAINALGANPGAVYLLEGTYNITGAINFDTTAPNDSGKALIGTGRGTVLKVVVNTADVTLTWNVIYAASVNRILISQLMIDGNRTGISGYNRGIRFYAVTYSKIDKVWVENIAGQVSGGNNMAISLSASSSNNIITNCNLANSPVGILMGSNCSNNIITHNNVQGNAGTGIYLWSSGPNQTNNIIADNNVQGNGGNGIYIVGSDSNLITNNNVQGNTGSGIYLSYTGTNTSDSNAISNNNIQGSNGTSGIYLITSCQNLITGNNVQNNTGYGIYSNLASNNNTITTNVIFDNGGTSYYSGIFFDDNCDANVISSNRIFDSSGTTSAYGIKINTNTSNDNYLIGNLIDGAGYDYGTRAVYDNGTNTKYTDKVKVTLERIVVVPTDGSPLDVSTSPQGYIALQPSGPISLNGTTAIYNGKAIGDMLVLEGTSDTNTVKIPNVANTVLIPNDSDPVPNKKLGLDDVLSLIWNGNDWVEKGWANN